MNRQTVPPRDIEHDAIVMSGIERDAHLFKIGECRLNTELGPTGRAATGVRCASAAPFALDSRLSREHDDANPREDDCMHPESPRRKTK